MSDLQNTIGLLNFISIAMFIVLCAMTNLVDKMCIRLAKRSLVDLISNQREDYSQTYAMKRYSFDLLRNRLSYFLGLFIKICESLVNIIVILVSASVTYWGHIGTATKFDGNVLLAVVALMPVAFIFSTITKALVFVMCNRMHNEVRAYRKGKLLCGN